MPGAPSIHCRTNSCAWRAGSIAKTVAALTRAFVARPQLATGSQTRFGLAERIEAKCRAMWAIRKRSLVGAWLPLATGAGHKFRPDYDRPPLSGGIYLPLFRFDAKHGVA